MENEGLTFEFYVTEDLSNVSLYANWAVELAGESGEENYMTFGPDGENAYEVALDGEALDYTPAKVGGEDEGSGQYKSGFHEYKLMSGLSLSAGKHTLTLTPRNENDAFGGMLTSVAPMTDYVRFEYADSGKIYWHPVYDNLDGKR